MMCETIDSAISSGELVAGRSPCDLPDGRTTDLFGLVAVPANRFPARVRVKRRPTPATSGQKCFGSSESAALSEFLGNRLRARLGTDGSMEYQQTWREKRTPLGRLYWVHTARARRISDNDFTGWPTAQSRDGDFRGASAERANGQRMNLDDYAMLAGWATRAEDSESTGAHHGNADTLTSQARLTGWASASSRDWKDTPGMAATGTNPDGSTRSRLDQLPRQAALAGAVGLTLPSSPAPMENSAASPRPNLNPKFSGWLMGFPRIWDSLAPTDFRSPRKRRAASVDSKVTETP